MGYHTLNQVLIGSFVGALFGLLWYATTNLMHSYGIIDYILDMAISQKLYIRDMSMIDNVARFEYQQWSRLRQNQLENKIK